MKKNIIFLSLLSLIIICAIFYPITEFLSKDKAKDLETLTIEKAKSAVKSIIPSFNKALDNSDDINLIINVESIAKIENIESCFILDKNSRVIIHNNTSEWNTEKSSEVYSKAIETKAELLQHLPQANQLLFSMPLINDSTLFCIFSTQKAKDSARYWKIKYYVVASFILAVIIIILYFLSKLFILLPFNRIKKALEQKSSQDLKEEKYNEITDIFVTEREKITKKIEVLEEDNQSLRKIIEYCQETSNKDNSAFIILNSLNNVVYAYDNTEKILKKGFSQDSHILEISQNPSLVKIVIKANETPGIEISESFENYKISAVSIDVNNKIAGTIIKVAS